MDSMQNVHATNEMVKRWCWKEDKDREKKAAKSQNFRVIQTQTSRRQRQQQQQQQIVCKIRKWDEARKRHTNHWITDIYKVKVG